jgi:hypothetical protein
VDQADDAVGKYLMGCFVHSTTASSFSTAIVAPCASSSVSDTGIGEGPRIPWRGRAACIRTRVHSTRDGAAVLRPGVPS